MTARIEASERFLDAAAALDPVQYARLDRALEKFQAHPRLPGLNLEKLSGRDNLWTIRVDRGNRVLMERARDAEGEFWRLLDYGPHDSYRGW